MLLDAYAVGPVFQGAPNIFFLCLKLNRRNPQIIWTII